MLNFSCADFTFPILGRRPALHLIKLLGFDFVDIGLFARSTHFSPRDLEACPGSYTTQIRQDLEATSLTASDIFLQIGAEPPEFAANDPDSATRTDNREHFKRTLDLTSALGCKHITGLPGVFHANTTRERDLGLAVEEAAWRLVTAADAGICYAIEAHIGSICPTVAATQAFLEAVPGLTLTLDYGHFIFAGENSSHVHPLLPFASHFHARGGAPNLLQTTMEENSIDFPAIIGGLQQCNYKGFLALEYVWINWQGCNRTDNVSETILLRDALASAIAATPRKAPAAHSAT